MNTQGIFKELQEPVIVYDGSTTHDRYMQWLHRNHEALLIFSNLFNKHLDEVLGSKKPFNQDWFLKLHAGQWGELQKKIDRFLQKSNKAVRGSYTDYYLDCMEDLQEAWNTYLIVYRSSAPGILERRFPYHLIKPENLPFVDDNIEFNLEKIDALKPEFDEYLSDPDQIGFYNLLINVRDTYREMEIEKTRMNISFYTEPLIGGVPYYLEKDNHGIWQLKDINFDTFKKIN